MNRNRPATGQRHAGQRLMLAAAGLLVAVLAACDGAQVPADAREEAGEARAAAAGSPASLVTARRAPEGAHWPMFGGQPALTGQAEGTLVDDLHLLWRFETGSRIVSSPVVADGMVYVAAKDGTLYALDLADGRPRWRRDLGARTEASPLVADGKVFIGTDRGDVHALDAADGEPIWQFATEERILAPANLHRVDGASLVLVGSYDRRLYAIDAQTGRQAWVYEADDFLNAAAAIDEGLVAFGGCDAMLHVVAAADGAMRHVVDVEAYVAGSVAIADGVAYVGNYAGTFLAVDLSTGEVLWRQSSEREGAFYSSPAVAGERIYVGCRDRQLYCLDRRSGEVVWTFATRGDVDSSPAVVGERVVFGSNDGRLYVVTTGGEGVWSYEIGRPVGSSPAIAGGWVIVGAEDGGVYAFGPRE